MTPQVRFFSEPPVNRREILRYAGAKDGAADVDALLSDCLKEAGGSFAYRACFQEWPLVQNGDSLDLGFAAVRSADLSRALKGCSRVVVFAATVGLGIDRLIARHSRLSPARALMMQAIGAERIESLCDAFSRETARLAAEENLKTTPRFSPGYGDLPLTLQKNIVQTLDCGRLIGLTLNESLLMSPSKSVTALIGLGCPTSAGQGCGACLKTDCAYRRLP